MKIRHFKLGDELALLHVFLSAVHGTACKDYTVAQIQAWAPLDLDPEQWALQMQRLQPFVVEDKHTIIAYADLQTNGYIDHFYVASTHAGQGVGRLLMHHLLRKANCLGLKKMTSDVSKTAEPFFARYGFRVVARGFPVRRGQVLQNALMEKDVL